MSRSTRPPNRPPSLRKRLEQSERLTGVVSWLVAGWLRFCYATTRWQRQGDDTVKAALADGPVVVILWHEHVMYGTINWKQDWGPAAVLVDTSPAGRLAGAVAARFGMRQMSMSPKMSNLAASREVMRLMQAGVTLGITADGPRGPHRVMKAAPLDWARVTGRPVFLHAYAMARERRLGTWDKMVLPLPFARGVSVYRRWDSDVPRRADAETLAGLRGDLEGALNRVLAEADARAKSAKGAKK